MLDSLLLNEVQKEHQQAQRQADEIQRQTEEIRLLQGRLAALEQLIADKASPATPDGK